MRVGRGDGKEGRASCSSVTCILVRVRPKDVVLRLLRDPLARKREVQNAARLQKKDGKQEEARREEKEGMKEGEDSEPAS